MPDEFPEHLEAYIGLRSPTAVVEYVAQYFAPEFVLTPEQIRLLNHAPERPWPRTHADLPNPDEDGA